MNSHRLVAIAVLSVVGVTGHAGAMQAQSALPVARAGQRIDGALVATDPFFRLANDSIRVKSYRWIRSSWRRAMVRSS